MLRATGVLSVEYVGGIALTRLTVGLDLGLRTERKEPIRIDDHLLDGHPLRSELRKLLLSEIGPFIKALGEVIRIVHDGPDALVILTSEPRPSESDHSHA